MAKANGSKKSKARMVFESALEKFEPYFSKGQFDLDSLMTCITDPSFGKTEISVA